MPDDWKKANIVPVFKKGDKQLPENYRPISLTSISSKLLEHIIHTNIMIHLDTNNLLSPFQHGFRKERNCETQLITTARDFADTLNKKGQTDAILLDFSKAFDKVDHHTLLFKLKALGINSPLADWVKSFLSNRTQVVTLEGVKSSPAPVRSGVPQGTVLGPLLFLIYVNDISDNLTPGTSIRLFADDSLLYRDIKTQHDTHTLQKDLDTLQMWEKINKMEFHPQKCQVMSITNKRSPYKHTYQIHNISLQKVNKAKYLGITIDDKLTYKQHISDISSKAHCTMSFIQRSIKKMPSNNKTTNLSSISYPLS